MQLAQSRTLAPSEYRPSIASKKTTRSSVSNNYMAGSNARQFENNLNVSIDQPLRLNSDRYSSDQVPAMYFQSQTKRPQKQRTISDRRFASKMRSNELSH